MTRAGVGPGARPARRVVLHVGTMKSGTTSIQSFLFGQRAALVEQGVLPLGRRWNEQAHGVQALIDRPEAPDDRWLRLVEQARAWDGTSVISMEYLGPFLPHRVEAAVASFGDLPVDVVVTLRDLNRTIPSLWQEVVQNGRSWSWPDYRAGARDARPWHPDPPRAVSEPGRTFWRQQHACRIVDRWSSVVGVDRVTVVTLPAPGAPRSTLLERVGRAVGFDPSGLAAPASQNTSLGAASAQLLQRVNARLSDLGLGDSDARAVRKALLAKQVLSARRDQEQPIGLEVEPWVVGTAGELVTRLGATGVRLEGDWHDLAPVAARGVDPSATSEEELVAAARFGFDGLREVLADRPVGADLPRWGDPDDADGAVRALADLVRASVRQADRTRP